MKAESEADEELDTEVETDWVNFESVSEDYEHDPPVKIQKRWFISAARRPLMLLTKLGIVPVNCSHLSCEKTRSPEAH